MDIPKFIDLAVELETELSELYKTIIARSPDSPAANRLKKLADAETRHANALRTGKSHYNAGADIFSVRAMDEAEIDAMLMEVKAYRGSVEEGNIVDIDQLEIMLEFEKWFERIYWRASDGTKAIALRNLFVSLTKSHQSRVLALERMVESFGKDGQEAS